MVYKEKSYHQALSNTGSISPLRFSITNNTNKDKIVILKGVSHSAFQSINGYFCQLINTCYLAYYDSNSVIKDYIYVSDWNDPYTNLNRRVNLKQGEKIDFSLEPGIGSYRYSRADLIYNIIEDL